jgi:F0F1-type ATP synthase assembly protein I
MSSTSSGTGLRRIAVRLLTFGALLVVVYWVLITLKVGKFGAESDIGGGLILLLAFGVLVAGAISLVVDLLRGRGERPHQ